MITPDNCEPGKVIAFTILGTLFVEVLVLAAVMKLFNYIDQIGSHFNGDPTDTGKRPSVYQNSGRQSSADAATGGTNQADEGQS